MTTDGIAVARLLRAPRKRVFEAWSWPELSVVDSVVTVDLVDHAEGTELLLRHELPPDPAIRQGHEKGWMGCLGSLENMLVC